MPECDSSLVIWELPSNPRILKSLSVGKYYDQNWMALRLFTVDVSKAFDRNQHLFQLIERFTGQFLIQPLI